MFHILSTIATMLFILSAQPSYAYYSMLDTGRVLDEDAVEVQAETQFVLTNDTGANLLGKVDKSLSPDFQIRGLLGLGTVDLQTGALLKYVPFPDYENQPAIGFIGGYIFSRNSSESVHNFRVTPFLSKTLAVDFGEVTPYAGLPLGLASYSNDDVFPVQLAIGTEVQHQDHAGFRGIIEIGMELNDAFNYLSLGLSASLE